MNGAGPQSSGWRLIKTTGMHVGQRGRGRGD